MKKTLIFLGILIILLIPTFFGMLRSGIYSTQDFHFFRLFEFDKCVRAFQIPCRWAPDAGLGYGEPLFNFYTQLPYAFAELFHLVGFGLIDSLKIAFALSLVLSGISMYFLASHLWKSRFAGLISAVLYVYAPYRAVDVWVRGALPEALSFVIFPLIILALEKEKYLLFSLSLAALVLTHNLSVLLFAPFLLAWIIFRRRSLVKVGAAAAGALLLSAFYILPVVFESKYIDLSTTTTGYFDFRAHFATLFQLLISRFWGYGGSTWGLEDGLSLSIGQLQWIIPVLISIFLIAKKKVKENTQFLFIFALGWFYLFMTHNKSTFIWEALPFMKYIQFPWRFLAPALFSFSLATGVVVNLFVKNEVRIVITTVLIILTVGVNIAFFKEDIWYNFKDSDLTTGAEWDRQRTASIGDFWPLFGHKIPDEPASGEFINYFPGWNHSLDENGLIPAKGAVFSDTLPRRVGNIISLVSLCVIIFLLFYL